MSRFERAVRHKAKLRLAIAGPAGGGKTYSALQIAFGLGGSIGMIDTEHGSGELYSHLGEYFVCKLDPPFTPDRYVELIEEAEAEFDIIIIDSLSHAWVGTGGVLSMLDKAVRSSRSGNSYTAWREVTPAHNRLVEAMLQSPAHVIGTMRSKMAHVIQDDGTGKNTVRAVGLEPVQRGGMEFEFTIFLDMSIEHIATCTKDRTDLFPIGEPFTPDADTGLKLLTWLESGEPTPEPVILSYDEMVSGMQEQTTVANLHGYYRQITSSIAQLSDEDEKKLMGEMKEHKQDLLAPKKE